MLAMIDLFTRKIVGWAMRDHMRAELTIAALTTLRQQGSREGPPHRRHIVGYANCHNDGAVNG